MQLIDIIRDFAGLIAGGVIGLAFGTLQQAALRRNEQSDRRGKLKSGWSLMPGSGARVAALVLTLAGIQLICPILFADGTQWWVSGGLMLGYGGTLLQQLRHRVNISRL